MKFPILSECNEMSLCSVCTEVDVSQQENSANILIVNFRKIIYRSVKKRHGLEIPTDVVSILVNFCFNKTNTFDAFYKKENQNGTPSLRRRTQLCEIPISSAQEGSDNFGELIGMTVYGFEVHQCPYDKPNDSNPFEITASRSIFLQPSKLSKWVVVDNGKTLTLPSRFDYDHVVSECLINYRETGPYLRLKMHRTADYSPESTPDPSQPNSPSTSCEGEKQEIDTRVVEIFAHEMPNEDLRRHFHHRLTPNPHSFGARVPSAVAADPLKTVPEMQLNVPGLHPTMMEFNHD